MQELRAVPGGNVKRFVMNLANGFITLNQTHLKSCTAGELRQLMNAIEQSQKELRCQPIDHDDLDQVKARNHKDSRLRTAIMVIKNFSYRRKIKF